MNYLKEYRSFVNSYYLAEGLRITFGVALPAIVLSYFNNLPAGIVMSLGAMSVGITDSPGPIHHRSNGMLTGIAIYFFTALITGLVAEFPIALGLVIAVFCFVFSLIGVYGARASAIGTAALLVMVLNIDHPMQGGEIWINALLIAAGGAWYAVLSLLLYRFRPYKLIEQALGECIQSTANYLRTKASFYTTQPNYEKNYLLLLEQQTTLHQQQELIRELLFKSRDIVKESTNLGRTLVVIFLDVVDLFETVMTSQEDYQKLHQSFDESGILKRYRDLILELAYDLDEIGIAVKSSKTAIETPFLATALRELKSHFEEFRDASRTAENVGMFISLRNILESLQDIADRLHTLHGYTMHDFKASKDILSTIDYRQFISHQDIEPELLKENLDFKSNLFRHSIRICIATTIGYCISKFLPFGHSYWVLLTIIVILKPAFGLTKKRNYERLLGTIAGAAIGLLLLLLFTDKTILLIWMILLMVLTYSFIRTRYLVSVLFMTPYILLLFHLLSPVHFGTVLTDRVIDTGIGSAIAFAASMFILPAWEYEQIGSYMIEMLENNQRYFEDVAAGFTGKPVATTQFKLARKNSFVSLANLTDAFNRMLSEPKSKQKSTRELHQFVVLNHMFTAHIATLSYYFSRSVTIDQPADLLPVVEGVNRRLGHAVANLQNRSTVVTTIISKEELRVLNDRSSRLMDQRRLELENGVTDSETRRKLSSFKSLVDQFNFIFKVAVDIDKLTETLRTGPAEEAASAHLN